MAPIRFTNFSQNINRVVHLVQYFGLAAFEVGNSLMMFGFRASPYPLPRRADLRQHQDQGLGDRGHHLLKLLQDATTVHELISASEIALAGSTASRFSSPSSSCSRRAAGAASHCQCRRRRRQDR